MFELYLDTTPNATRKQVIDALRKSVIEEITVANAYEQTLRKSCSLSNMGRNFHMYFFLVVNVMLLVCVLFSL